MQTPDDEYVDIAINPFDSPEPFSRYLTPLDQSALDTMHQGFYHVSLQAAEILCASIADPNIEEISWHHPRTETRYLIGNFGDPTIKPLIPLLTDKTQLLLRLRALPAAHILGEHPSRAAVIRSDDKPLYYLAGPTSTLDNCIIGGRFPSYSVRAINPVTNKPRNYRIAFFNFIWPVTFDTTNEQVYFPVTPLLHFDTPIPDTWAGENRAEFVLRLIDDLQESALGGTGLRKRGIKKQITSTLAADTTWVKGSLHLEKQKQRSTQLSLLETEELPETELNRQDGLSISVIGLDFTVSHERAVHALQIGLQETKYEGNLPMGQSKNLTWDGANFYSPTVGLRFSWTQWYEWFGVPKYITHRDWAEFSGEGKQQARKALRDLASMPVMLVWKREKPGVDKKGEPEQKIDRRVYRGPLIAMLEEYKDLTKTQDQQLDEGIESQATAAKQQKISVAVMPIFQDQIKSYFLMRRANYIEEVRLKFRNPSPYLIHLLNWLAVRVTEMKLYSAPRDDPRWTIEIGYRKLAANLRMHGYIARERWRPLRETILKLYGQAKDLNYLLNYEIKQGQTDSVDHLKLNPERYYHTKPDDQLPPPESSK